MKIFTQGVYILCRNCETKCAAASEHIFYVSANVWLLPGVFQCFLKKVWLLLKDTNERMLLKENVQLLLNIFFYVEDCVAAFGNISMFLMNMRVLLKRYFTAASESKKFAS